MSKDTIYREDAIKALGNEPMVWTFEDEYTMGQRSQWRVDVTAIESMPSADRPQGDYVNRRYLLAEIDDLADEFSELDENGLHGERWCGIMDAKGVIVNAPDVSDRPEGEWIEFDTKWGRSFYYCTNCMETSEVPTAFGQPLYNFCPNCGARMKGAYDEH